MRRSMFFAAVSASAITGQVLANVTVKGSGGSSIPASTYSVTDVGGTFEVEIVDHYQTGLFNWFEVYASNGEVISSIRFSVPNSPGTPTALKVLPHPTTGQLPHSVLEISKEPDTGEVIVNKLLVAFDVGSVIVDDIGKIDAGRDIYGPIIATVDGERGVTNVVAARDLLGDVLAPQGRIKSVAAYRSIGTADAPITVAARNRIVQVGAINDIYADVLPGFYGGTAQLARVECDRFFGSIITDDVIPNELDNGPGRFIFRVALGGTITIGNAFNGTNDFMQLPAGGLQTQIVINANDAGGTWTAPVRVGEPGDFGYTVLSGDGYTAPAALLGGGSVGLAPFGLHDESCLPVNNDSVESDPAGKPLEVGLRFYGPVGWSAGAPVQIARRPIGALGDFENLDAADFDYEISAETSNTLLLNGATSEGFAGGYVYRITRGTLHCAGVLDNPPVAPFTYEVTVIEPTQPSPDLNGDGAVNGRDMGFMLGQWGGPGSADLNLDGVVNGLDLGILLANWG